MITATMIILNVTFGLGSILVAARIGKQHEMSARVRAFLMRRNCSPIHSKKLHWLDRFGFSNQSVTFIGPNDNKYTVQCVMRRGHLFWAEFPSFDRKSSNALPLNSATSKEQIISDLSAENAKLQARLKLYESKIQSGHENISEVN